MNSISMFFRKKFDPVDPLRKYYYTASSYATWKNWSPYKRNAPVSEFLARRGHAMEAMVIEKLSEDFEKVEESFISEMWQVVGTPDIVSKSDSKLFPPRTYGEIKGVFIGEKNLEDRFYHYFDNEAFNLDKIISDRKKSNLFSHLVQCLINIYATTEYHNSVPFNPHFYLFHSLNATNNIVGQKLVITDRRKFRKWVEDGLIDLYVDPKSVREFLKCEPYTYSK